jgi:hypothetical protein
MGKTIVFRHAALKQEKRLRTRRRNSEFPAERRDPQIFIAALRATAGWAAVGNLICKKKERGIV